MRIQTDIRFFGGPATVSCDGRCDKAWGMSQRPKVQLSDNEDDFVFVRDSLLGTAPVDPGTYEGDCAKECERSVLGNSTSVIPDLENPLPNIPRSV